MFPGKTVGIFVFRKKQYFHVHAFSQKHVGATEGSMNACGITVVEEHNVLRESVKGANLVDAECCARVGHHILNPALVHGNHIHVALHHVHFIFLCYLFLGLVDAVQFVVLMEYLRFG